jgi:hypothetical protein
MDSVIGETELQSPINGKAEMSMRRGGVSKR